MCICWVNHLGFGLTSCFLRLLHMDVTWIGPAIELTPGYGLERSHLNRDDHHILRCRNVLENKIPPKTLFNQFNLPFFHIFPPMDRPCLHRLRGNPFGQRWLSHHAMGTASKPVPGRGRALDVDEKETELMDIISRYLWLIYG